MASSSAPPRTQVHFIADVHLQDGVPSSWRDFFAYLDGRARSCKAVYLLGDIFDAWIGDDDDRELAREVVRRLRAVTASGVEVGYVLGNHDFLLSRLFARQTGVRLLGYQAVVEAAGRQVLVIHGDVLCTHDQAYQRQRSKYTQPWLLELIRLLPRWVRRRRAAQMLDSDQAKLMKHSHAKADEQLVQDMLAQSGADEMICGHLHVQAGRRQLANGGNYYLLPHWPAVDGPGGALVADVAGIRLVSLAELLQPN